MGTPHKLEGLRILLVEDQMIVAMELEDVLRGAGCEIVGPLGTLRAALAIAHEGVFDAAVLDVNLDGELIFPVADALRARGIPFVFATGYGEATLPAKWRDWPRLTKPFNCDHIERLIERVSNRRSAC